MPTLAPTRTREPSSLSPVSGSSFQVAGRCWAEAPPCCCCLASLSLVGGKSSAEKSAAADCSRRVSFTRALSRSPGLSKARGTNSTKRRQH